MLVPNKGVFFVVSVRMCKLCSLTIKTKGKNDNIIVAQGLQRSGTLIGSKPKDPMNKMVS